LGDVSTEAVTLQDASSLPAYVNLLAVQNTSGSAWTPPGLILGWRGDTADIPDDWVLCDGTGDTLDLTSVQVRAAQFTSEVGESGGDNTHVHDSDGTHVHTHTGSHTHTAETLLSHTLDVKAGTASFVTYVKNHTHAWTVSGETPTMQSASFSTDSADGRYLWREVNWIKYSPGAKVRIDGGRVDGGKVAAFLIP